MTMAAATLSAQLQAISGGTEAAAITSWSAAWSTYFADAIAGSGPGVPVTTNPTAIANARTAMETQMVGLATTGLSAGKVQAGIIGWWDHLVANPATFFTGATSITKPSGLTGIAAALPAIFTNNVATSASAAVACGDVAASIHGNNAGGSANISGSQTIT